MKRFASLTSCALLALALPLVAQQPRLESGPAALLSSSPSYTEAPGGQRFGTAVPTDAGWITVWADDVIAGIDPPERRLIATRLLPDGSVRDRIGIRLSSDLTYRAFTAVPVPGGARVFWGADSNEVLTLRTATVSDEGEVSDTDVIGEYPADAIYTSLTAASSGNRTAVHLDRYVIVLDGTRVLKTVDLGGFGEPSSIVAVGSYFVVSWTAGGGILMRQTIDLDENVTGPAGGTGVAAPVALHNLATDGSEALFVWSEASSVHIGLLDPSSGVFVEKGVVASQPAGPQAVWAGSSYLVTWVSAETGALVGVHVSRDGEILDAQPVTLFESNPGYFELVARGSEAMLLRQTGACYRLNCETDVVATPLGGESMEDHLISAAASVQSYPTVASDGHGFLVLWHEGRKLFATETGERSRTPTAPVDFGETPGDASVAASDGASYLTAWAGIHDGAFAVEGKVLVPGDAEFTMKPFSIPGGAYFPFNVSAGASPGMYLVSWRDGYEYVAVRVGSREATVLDNVPFRLFDDAYSAQAPSIAFDGVDFLAAWSSYDDSKGPHYLVRTVRVGLDGTVRFDRIWLDTTAGIGYGTSIGCGEGTCLIVWSEQTSDATNRWRLAGQRFRSGGTLIDALPFDIDVADRSQYLPSVAWDGGRFVVTWRKYNEAVTPPERLEAKVIPASGAIEPSLPGIVLEHETAYSSPVTTCNHNGSCIVVGQGLVDDTTLGRTSRLFKRFFGEARHRAVRR